MSNFNCRVGEAIDFPRAQKSHHEPTHHQKCKSCEGGLAVLSYVVTGEDLRPETPITPIPLKTVFVEGFRPATSGKLVIKDCGTFKIVVKFLVGRFTDIDPGTTLDVVRTSLCTGGTREVIASLPIPAGEFNEISMEFSASAGCDGVCLQAGDILELVLTSGTDETDIEQGSVFELIVAKVKCCCDDISNVSVCNCPGCNNGHSGRRF